MNLIKKFLLPISGQFTDFFFLYEIHLIFLIRCKFPFFGVISDFKRAKTPKNVHTFNSERMILFRKNKFCINQFLSSDIYLGFPNIPQAINSCQLYNLLGGLG